jgi:hypothetical protein
LVASRCGLAALRLWSELYAAGTADIMAQPYAQDLVQIIRDTCAEKLSGIKLL